MLLHACILLQWPENRRSGLNSYIIPHFSEVDGNVVVTGVWWPEDKSICILYHSFDMCSVNGLKWGIFNDLFIFLVILRWAGKWNSQGLGSFTESMTEINGSVLGFGLDEMWLCTHWFTAENWGLNGQKCPQAGVIVCFVQKSTII